MAKTKLERAEKVLGQLLQRLFIADLVKKTEKKQERAEKEKISNKNVSNLLKSLTSDIGRLSKGYDKIWEELGISKAEIQRYIDNPNSLSDEDLGIIKDFQEKIKEFKASTAKKLEEEHNDGLVSEEREKHLEKRHNVKEGWKHV